MSLHDVGQSGDRLETLRGLRDRLTAAVDATEDAYQLAQLSNRLEAVLQQIEAVERARPEKKGTPLDELHRKRAARSGSASSKGGTKSSGSG